MGQLVNYINSIEISSLCDNQCQYCPAKDQGQYRPTGLMTMETFERTLAWVKHFCKQGTQRELNLFGVGEPTLNPHLVDMVREARRELPFDQIIHINTNGNNMTESLARALIDAGITSIDITGHDPYIAARTIRILRSTGIKGQLSIDPITQPNNWAGQVDWFAPDYSYPCQWLDRGQVMVMSDGRINTCCIDAFAKQVIGTVDDNVPDLETEPGEVCSKCHHIVPARLYLRGDIEHANHCA